MRLRGVTIFLLAAIMLNACQMQKLTIEAYSPPKLELPPDVRGILVASRYVPAEGEYEAVQWGYFESVDSAKWELSKNYAQTFSKVLDSSERYISITDFDARMLRNNNDTIPEPLPWSGMQKIVEKHGATGLAILEGFDITEGEAKVINKSNGESGYLAKKEIIITAAWRITQPERRRMLDEKIYSFTKEFTGQGSTEDEAQSDLPDVSDMHKQACEWAASEYAKLIIPGFDLVERDYYTDGDIKLEEAHAAILEGDWKKAESKWNYLSYNSDSDEVKAKASYNMAMLAEKDGRLNQALGFARKANKFIPHNRHLKLINELTTKMFNEEKMREDGDVIRNW